MSSSLRPSRCKTFSTPVTPKLVAVLLASMRVLMFLCRLRWESSHPRVSYLPTTLNIRQKSTFDNSPAFVIFSIFVVSQPSSHGISALFRFDTNSFPKALTNGHYHKRSSPRSHKGPGVVSRRWPIHEEQVPMKSAAHKFVAKLGS